MLSSLVFSNDFREPKVLESNHYSCQSDKECEFEVYLNLDVLKRKKIKNFLFSIRDEKTRQYIFVSKNDLDKIKKSYSVESNRIVFKHRLHDNEEGLYTHISFLDEKGKHYDSQGKIIKAYPLGLNNLKKNDSAKDPIGFLGYIANNTKLYKSNKLSEKIGVLNKVGLGGECYPSSWGISRDYKVNNKEPLSTFNFDHKCGYRLLEVYGITEDWVKLKSNDKFVFLKRNKYGNRFKTVHETLGEYISHIGPMYFYDDSLKDKKMFKDYVSIFSSMKTVDNIAGGIVHYKGYKVHGWFYMPSLSYTDYKYVDGELYLRLQFSNQCNANKEKTMNFFKKAYEGFSWVKYRDLKLDYVPSC